MGGTHPISLAKIQAVSPSPVSIMPEGLMQVLRRDELVDLVRFLSELGRPGPYQLPVERFVRTWRVLEQAPRSVRAAAGFGVVEADPSAFSWKTTYSAVDGSLPLGEIPAFSSRPFSWLRFTVIAERPTLLLADDPGGLTLSVDGRRIGPWVAKGVELDEGSHDCILVVDRNARRESLRIELRDRG